MKLLLLLALVAAHTTPRGATRFTRRDDAPEPVVIDVMGSEGTNLLFDVTFYIGAQAQTYISRLLTNASGIFVLDTDVRCNKGKHTVDCGDDKVLYTFQPKLSLTYRKQPNGGIESKNDSGTLFKGQWGWDKFRIGNLRMEDAPFGYLKEIPLLYIPQFGLGPSALFGSDDYSLPSILLNRTLLGNLKSRQRISTEMYSLFRVEDPWDAVNGSTTHTRWKLILGGVDTAKLASDFTELPLMVADGVLLVLNSISVDNSTVIKDGHILNLCLECRSRFPGEAYTAMESQVKRYATPDDKGFFNCSDIRNVDLTLDFGGTKITIPLTSLLETLVPTRCRLRQEKRSQAISLGYLVWRYLHIAVNYDAKTFAVASTKFTEALSVQLLTGELPNAVLGNASAPSLFIAGGQRVSSGHRLRAPIWVLMALVLFIIV